MLFADDSICVEIEVFAASPTPRPPTQAPIASSVPEIGPLTASILARYDKLFFISHRVRGSAITEWALYRVDLKRSVQAHPAALHNGRFIVDFYTCHPSDRRYCLEYHPALSLADPHRKVAPI